MTIKVTMKYKPGNYWGTSSQKAFDGNGKKTPNTPNQNVSHHRLLWTLNNALRVLLPHPVLMQVREDRLIKLSRTKEASGGPLKYQVPVPSCYPLLDSYHLFDSLQARYPFASGLH